MLLATSAQLVHALSSKRLAHQALTNQMKVNLFALIAQSVTSVLELPFTPSLALLVSSVPKVTLPTQKLRLISPSLVLRVLMVL